MPEARRCWLCGFPCHVEPIRNAVDKPLATCIRCNLWEGHCRCPKPVDVPYRIIPTGREIAP
jgi:hypothetical protein